ncbi:flavonol reductase [Aulographum hederae CBS 113979]|uniref:Flavonol reductase n=1 Tax=Aulographum hederae CBS 113979 TaxID=1176131 RepID=A0A6G1GQK2_9PEZI|nr:flavonol reductase [Aulographum hederae CBS 113979]
MPKPTSEQTILVTGAAGFVAAHVMNSFLEKGYKIRGTVRTEKSADSVRKSHSKYADRLSFVFVQDIAASGAFDEAVKGVDGVIHTASPFILNVEDSERDLLIPAIKGTTGVLEALAKNNPDATRVVITSSFASIIDMSQGYRPGYTYSEADWNPATYDEAKADNGGFAYCASKCFAERAAFDYVEKNKPTFSVATICPPMTYGPIAHTVASMDKLNTSSADIWRFMNGTTEEVPLTDFCGFVDVRDLADAHLRAFETPEAANQRFLVTGGNYSYQKVCDVLNALPGLGEGKVPVGKPGTTPEGEVYKYDTSRAKEVLGMRFRGLEECVMDTAESLLGLEKAMAMA